MLNRNSGATLLLFFESNKSELCLGRNGREKEGKRPLPNFRKLSIRWENACEIAILVKIVTVHLSLRISQELLKLPRSPLFSKTLGIMSGKIGYGINWCVSFRRDLWTRWFFFRKRDHTCFDGFGEKMRSVPPTKNCVTIGFVKIFTGKRNSIDLRGRRSLYINSPPQTKSVTSFGNDRYSPV